jgi:dolichyl-diphosphooligosaccharide--protein glycosyltransferase
MAPIVCALLIGGVVSYAVHTAWDWHQSFVALTPALLADGAIGVTAIGEVWWRRLITVDLLLPTEAAVASVGSYVYIFHITKNQDLIIARINDLLLREAATETASLFTSGFVVVVVFRFGIPFFIAIIALV